MLVPSGPEIVLRKAAKESANVAIIDGIAFEYSIVNIPCHLPPGVKNHFFVGMFGMESGDDAAHGVVEQSRTDADYVGEFELVRGAEEGFVLAYGLSFVVENGPAGSEPARVDLGSGRFEWPGRSLSFFLSDPAKAVRVRERMLNLRVAAGFKIRQVILSSQRISDGGMRLGIAPRACECEKVADKSSGRSLQDFFRIAQRMADVLENRALAEIGNEAVERIALAVALFAHDGRASEHPERIKRRRGPVAVGVGNQLWSENAIVSAGCHCITDRILCFDQRQIMRVECNQRCVSEGIAVTARREEMPAGIREFGGCGVVRMGRVK